MSSESLSSIVELVDFDLHLFKLFEKLLQLNLWELNFLSPIDIGGGELLEVSLLDVLVIFSGLLICLQIERYFTDGCPDVSG